MESIQVVELSNLSALRLQCSCGASVSYPLEGDEDIVTKLLAHRCPLHQQTPMQDSDTSWNKAVSKLAETILMLKGAANNNALALCECTFEVGQRGGGPC